MIVLAALLLAGAPIDEAEHALAAGRVEQAETMLKRMVEAGQTGQRIDILRAGVAARAGRHSQALSLYGALAAREPSNPSLAEGAARSAFLVGDIAAARRWIAPATAHPSAGWNAWNLCGAIADSAGDFDRADRCYEKARELAPGRPQVLNNQAWSYLLRGHWAEAGELLRDAAGADPANPVIRANLDLAEAALASDLPSRRKGESADDYAARLNDAGVIAEAAGDRRRAIAAFANAVHLRPAWSGRVARNIAAVEGK